MYSRHVRAGIGMVLVFSLLSMMMPRAAMALPMALHDAAPQLHEPHDAAVRMTGHVSSSHTAPHNGQHDSCPCGVHDCSCVVCYFGFTANAVKSFVGALVTPGGPRQSNFAAVFLPPDPRPPRA